MGTPIPAIILLWVLALCSASARFETPESKLDWLRTKSSASKDHFVSLDKTQFIKLVLNGPRPYNLVLMFTTLDPEINCPSCRTLMKETKLLGDSVYAASQKADVPTFMAYVVYSDRKNDNVRELYRLLGLGTVPSMVFVPAEDDIVDTKPKSFLGQCLPGHKFDFNSKGVKPETILTWINSQSKLGATLLIPINWNDVLMTIAMPVVGIGFLFYLFGPQLLKIRNNTKIYVVLAFAIYLFSVSGGMYNILKDTPWVHTDHRGVSYLHGDNGWQLGAESYICGGVQLLLGILLIFVSTTALEIKSDIVRQVFVGIGILICFYLWYNVRWLATFKMGGYNNGWVYRWI